MFKSNLENKLIFKKFLVGSLIYKSNFSFIHEGINKNNKEQVAMKFEKILGNYNYIESEAYLLCLLKGKGIPKLISYGKSGKYNVLIEELLGKSIYKLLDLQYKDMKKKINDVCLIALQCLDRLEYIHSKDIIHKDIKMLNFLFGKKDPELIYLIDFGMAKKFRSSKTGKHIKFNNLKIIEGSLRYKSINSIRGYEESRRDDLESLGYVLVFLLKKFLPWTRIEKMDLTPREKNKKIIEIKSTTLPEEICQGLPKEFAEYIKYSRKLLFEQNPNYDYLRHLFLDIILKNDQLPDYTYIDYRAFSWIKEKEIKRKFESFSNRKNILSSGDLNNTLSKHTNNFHKRLYSQIKDSINRTKSQEKVKEDDNNVFKPDLKNINIIINNISSYSKDKIDRGKNEKINENMYKKIDVKKNNPFIINNATSKKKSKKSIRIIKEKRDHSNYTNPITFDKITDKREENMYKIGNKKENIMYHKYLNSNIDNSNLLHLNNFSMLQNLDINQDGYPHSLKLQCYKTLKEREKEKGILNFSINNVKIKNNSKLYHKKIQTFDEYINTD